MTKRVKLAFGHALNLAGSVITVRTRAVVASTAHIFVTDSIIAQMVRTRISSGAALANAGLIRARISDVPVVVACLVPFVATAELIAHLEVAKTKLATMNSSARVRLRRKSTLLVN